MKKLEHNHIHGDRYFWTESLVGLKLLYPLFIDPLRFKRILHKITLPFLLLIFSLCFAFVFEMKQILTLYKEIKREDAYLITSSNAQKLLNDAEAGLRGYILTDRPEHLNAFKEHKDLLEGELDDLGHLMTAKGIQLYRMSSIAFLYREWKHNALNLMKKKNLKKEAKTNHFLLRRNILEALSISFSELDNYEVKMRTGNFKKMDVVIKRGLFWIFGLGLFGGVFLTLMLAREMRKLTREYNGVVTVLMKHNRSLEKKLRLPPAWRDLRFVSRTQSSGDIL